MQNERNLVRKNWKKWGESDAMSERGAREVMGTIDRVAQLCNNRFILRTPLKSAKHVDDDD